MRLLSLSVLFSFLPFSLNKVSDSGPAGASGELQDEICFVCLDDFIILLEGSALPAQPSYNGLFETGPSCTECEEKQLNKVQTGRVCSTVVQVDHHYLCRVHGGCTLHITAHA